MKKRMWVFVAVLLALTLTACDETASEDASQSPPITDLQMALLCDVVYNDRLDEHLSSGEPLYDPSGTLISDKYINGMPDRGLPQELEGYTVVDFDHGDITGFRAAAFQKGKSVVMVYCGTEDWADIEGDIVAALFDFSTQDGQAKRFAEDNAKKYRDCQLYVAGYSMGGRLAYLGAEALSDSGHGSRLRAVRTFNGLGVKEAFDLTNTHLSNLYGLESKFGDVTVNYIVAGDFVSDPDIANFRSLAGYTHVGQEQKYSSTNPNDRGSVMWQHDLYTFIDILSQRGAPERDTGGETGNQIITDITDSDLRELERVLVSTYTIPDEFDCATYPVERLMADLWTGDCGLYFPGTCTQDTSWGEKADPKGRFYAWYKLDADQCDWIVRNIYHLTPNRAIDNADMYVDGDSYYVSMGGIGGPQLESAIREITPLEGGRYAVSYQTWVVGEPPEEDISGYAVVDLEQIDGRRVWTFYKTSWSPLAPASTPAP